MGDDFNQHSHLIRQANDNQIDGNMSLFGLSKSNEEDTTVTIMVSVTS